MIRRRRFLTLAGAAAGAHLMRGVLPRERQATAADASKKPSRPPNVVLIISDDQGWGDYGFMGHPTIETPNIDRLASQSLVLTRGYVPTSLCRPSLGTIVTGRYPHQHGSVGNDPRGGARNLAGREEMVKSFERLDTLPRLLAGKGYVSFQSGKWWEGHHSRGGFTAGMTHGDPKRGGRHGDAGLKIGRTGMKPVFDFMDKAVVGDKPFFLWYAPFLPHSPHNPPKRLLDKYTAPGRSKFIARYWAMCEWFDETCGQLLGYLDKKHLAANTLVAYVCDNGWIQKTNSGGADFSRSKRSPYDGGVRTPIMLRWPGRVPPRTDKQTLAQSIDLAPTILAACGLKATADMPGVNLLDSAAAAKRKAIFGEIFSHDIVDFADPASGLQYRWCIEGRWKLIAPHNRGRAQLYDIIADPHETKDLAAGHPDKVAHLRKLLDAWWPAKRKE